MGDHDEGELCGFRWPADHGGEHSCSHARNHGSAQHWCRDDGAHVDVLDIANRFMLGVRASVITPMVPIQSLDPAAAVLVAAWLVALAEGIDPDAADLFERTLNGVRNT